MKFHLFRLHSQNACHAWGRVMADFCRYQRLSCGHWRQLANPFFSKFKRQRCAAKGSEMPPSYITNANKKINAVVTQVA